MAKNNRVLVIGTTDIVGGAAQVGWSVGEFARNQGLDVKYLVSRKYSDKEYVKNLDDDNHMSLSSIVRHGKTFISGSDINTGHQEEILREPWYKDATIVHCHNLHGNYFRLSTLLDIAKDKKLIWTLHDSWAILPDVPYGARTSPLDYPPMVYPRRKYLMESKKQIFSQLKGTLVVPSEWLLRQVEYRKEFGGFAIKLIRNGIDLEMFKPRDKKRMRKKYNLDPDQKFGIFVGNTHDKRKGWQHIKLAIESDPSLQVLVVGSGGIDTKQVKYFGSQGQEVLAEILCSADYLLAPSLEENASLTIMQSIACGVPVIAYSSGGIPEQIIHHETGFLTTQKSSQGLAEGISWISNLNASEYRNVAKNCRDHAEKHFDEKEMLIEYFKLYQQ